MQKATKTCEQQTKQKLSLIKPINLKIHSCIQSCNDLLKKTVTPAKILQEIGNDGAKRQFAQQGLKIYKNTHNQLCAFCGNPITDERLSDLESMFDTQYQTFQGQIQDSIESVKHLTSCLQEVKTTLNQALAQEHYYAVYQDKSLALRSKINLGIASNINTLFQMQQQLETKQTHINIEIEAHPHTEFAEPDDLIQQVNNLIEENNQYSDNSEDHIRNAQDMIRKQICIQITRDKQYQNYIIQAKTSQNLVTHFQQEKAKLESRIKEMRQSINQLQAKMSDEKTAADNINKALKLLGDDTFRLQPLTRGIYEIHDLQSNQPRPINGLSDGEKNIVAFIYFMQELLKDANQRQAVIIDDPMNSNDSKSQYLMYGYINEICSRFSAKQSNNILVVLTHNINFFINARPYGWKPKNRRFKAIDCFRIHRERRTTYIDRIEDPADDIYTAYDELWKDFAFAYKNNRPGLMYNTSRRITTTYQHFTHTPSPTIQIKQQSEEYDPSTGTEKKAFDENSHEILDTSTVPQAFSRDGILNLVHTYFNNLQDNRHFETMWNMAKEAEHIQNSQPSR